MLLDCQERRGRGSPPGPAALCGAGRAWAGTTTTPGKGGGGNTVRGPGTRVLRPGAFAPGPRTSDATAQHSRPQSHRLETRLAFRLRTSRARQDQGLHGSLGLSRGAWGVPAFTPTQQRCPPRLLCHRSATSAHGAPSPCLSRIFSRQGSLWCVSLASFAFLLLHTGLCVRHSQGQSFPPVPPAGGSSGGRGPSKTLLPPFVATTAPPAAMAFCPAEGAGHTHLPQPASPGARENTQVECCCALGCFRGKGLAPAPGAATAARSWVFFPALLGAWPAPFGPVAFCWNHRM